MQVRQDCNWPTAVVNDSKNTKNKNARRSDPESAHHSGSTLCDAVEDFPTPHSSCHAGAGSAGRSGGDNLQTAVAEKPKRLNPDWVAQLMTLPADWLYPRGYRNRVDELRLAGNGVVPAAAEIAVSMALAELADPG